MAGSPSIDRVELPSTGDLSSVDELKTSLLSRLEAGRSVHLDGSQVGEPSTPLIEAIEAAAISFGARDLQVGLVEPSDALCSAYEDLGMFSALMSRLAAVG